MRHDGRLCKGIHRRQLVILVHSNLDTLGHLATESIGCSHSVVNRFRSITDRQLDIGQRNAVLEGLLQGQISICNPFGVASIIVSLHIIPIVSIPHFSRCIWCGNSFYGIPRNRLFPCVSVGKHTLRDAISKRVIAARTSSSWISSKFKGNLLLNKMFKAMIVVLAIHNLAFHLMAERSTTSQID